jgi:hypothetical protein
MSMARGVSAGELVRLVGPPVRAKEQGMQREQGQIGLPVAPDGASAVEVVATFGGTVVEVRHLGRSEGPGRRKRALGLMAAGAFMVLIAAGSFAHGVSVAAEDQAARQAHLDRGLPVFEFRPQRLHPIHDWLTFGGLGLGIAAIGLGLARLRDRGRPSGFRIGRDDRADLATEDAPAEPFALVRDRGDAMVVAFTPEMTGELRVGGVARSLEALAAEGGLVPSAAGPGARELALPEGAEIVLGCGRTRYRIRTVAAPRRQPVPILAAVDVRATRFVAASALAHLGLVAVLRTIPPDPAGMSIGLGSGAERITRVESKAADEDRPTEGSLGGDSGGAEGSQSSPGEQGAIGTPEGDRTAARLQIEQRAERPSMSRADAVAAARESGIVGHLHRSGGLASFQGFDETLSGFDDHTVDGDLAGGGTGGPYGTFGNYVTGFGPGGGGPNDGLVYTGNYDTIPGPGGDGTGPGGPGDGLDPRGHEPVVPVVNIDPPIDDGGDDHYAALVQRRIKRHLASIRYCYERELMAEPDLAGTVKVVFVISGEGAVVAAHGSGIGHDDLEDCVAGVIRGISFPRPPGGSSVKITYPFRFHRAGR